MRPICKEEGCLNPGKTNGHKKDGSRKYYKICSWHLKKKYNQGPNKKQTWTDAMRVKMIARKYNGYIKLPYCECCSFQAEHLCQLDVDHIDGNHDNNSHENLQTLCSNCHRLKTWKNKDYL